MCFERCSQQHLFFFPILFGHGSWAVEGRGGKEHDKACFYFGEGSIFRLLYWGIVTMFQKYWSWAKQMTPLGRKKQEKKKEKRVHHLTNQ
jgi:hypothetical protein